MSDAPPPPPPDLRRNAAAVGLANGLSRLSGLAREVVFAAVFGASPAADAFNVASRVSSLFRELLAEGALTSAFVPAYAREAEANPAQGWALANALLGVLLLALGAVTLLTLLLAEPLVLAFAAGFEDTPARLDLSVALTRVLSPFVALISIAALWMGMLNVRGRFFGPALSPVLLNAAVIAACALAGPWAAWTGQDPITAVAWASLLGGGAQAAVLLPGLWRAGYRPWPSLRGHPALRGVLRFFGPALVAISVTQLHLLIETQLASREGTGPVSWLLYAFRVAHLPLSVVSLSVGAAALAGLSVLRARGDQEGFRAAFLGACRLNSFLSLPAAVLVYTLAGPLVALIFERGAFTPDDSARTAELLRAYALALWGIGAQRVLIVSFYAAEDPHRPMWVGLGALALKLPLALALMAWVGLAGVPLSHAALAAAEVALLVALLHGRIGGLWGPWARYHLRGLGLALALGAALTPLASRLPDLAALLLLPPLTGALWLGLAWALGLDEGRALLDRVRRRGRGPIPGSP